MKKNLTEMVFILDKSGSMAGLEADTIGGFNSMIQRQKQAEGEALVSTVLFSNSSTVIPIHTQAIQFHASSTSFPVHHEPQWSFP